METHNMKPGWLLMNVKRRAIYVVIAREGEEYVEARLIEAKIHSSLNNRAVRRRPLLFRWHIGDTPYADFERIA